MIINIVKLSIIALPLFAFASFATPMSDSSGALCSDSTRLHVCHSVDEQTSNQPKDIQPWQTSHFIPCGDSSFPANCLNKSLTTTAQASPQHHHETMHCADSTRQHVCQRSKADF